MTDPWAEDWGDDWSKPLKQPVESSTELWRQANNVKSTPISQVAPNIGYKPPLKILKREVTPNTEEQNKVTLSAAEKAQIAAAEKLAREQRYREARERLFGSPNPSPGPEVKTNTRGSKTASPVPQGAPERQSRGPEEGKRGFANRGRGRGQ